ncbi:MAG: 6-phosphogluconolactonase [Microbacteriaceae bacterium]
MTDERANVTTPVTIFDSAAQAGAALADLIVDGIRAAAEQGRRYVLCTPSGRTPVPVYIALAERIRTAPIPLHHVIVTMLDEYVEPDADGGYRPVDARLPHSCTRWGVVEVLERLNAASPTTPLARESLWVPDPATPEGYEDRLRELGGFDLLLLATGASDGHVAFNPQGTERDARTRVVELAEHTRRDNLRTFPTFCSLDEVPRHGVTIGPGSMSDLAARTVMLITGAEKREAASRVLHASGYDPGWPATIIAECTRPAIFIDRDAVPAAIATS